jgi:tetratricopeptide (TPR) repeat protein
VLNGDPAAALDHLDSALQQDPLNQSILERAARAAEMAGQNGRSRLYWDVLANLDTQSAEIQYQRVLALCRDGFWDDARNHLDGNLKTYPRHPGLRLLSALFAEDHGAGGLGLLTLPDMAALLRELHLRRDVLSTAFPKHYGPVARLVLLGGVEAASTNLTSVADNSYWSRTAALAQRYLVDAEQAMRGGKAARMLESLDAAGKVGVDGPWFRLYRAQGWMDSGRMDEGARALQLVVDGYGDKAEIALRAGRILLDIDRPAAALLLFTRAVELERDNPENRFALACANIAQGNVQAAMTQYRWVRDNHPALAAAWIKGDEPYLRLLRERVRP